MTHDWWWFANEDMETARVLLEEGEHLAGATFHCQQAVEKMLKGALKAGGMEVPKIHDLMWLLRLCEKTDPGCGALKDACHTLNKYYVPVRYPDAIIGSGPWGPPDQPEAQEALRLADEAWRFFQERRRPQVRERRVSYRRSPARRRKK